MSKVVAKALYDNLAESVDELSFQKGDILTIIEQNANNIDGWWLCSLRGQQGLCPGNRLRIISTTIYSEKTDSPMFEMMPELNLLQQQGKRRSWHVQPNKVVTPKKFKDIYLYDNPHMFNQRNEREFYDVPRTLPMNLQDPTVSQIPLNVDISASYDIPRPYLHLQLTPSSSASSLATDSLDSIPNNSSKNISTYDIPRSHFQSYGSEVYDVPSSQQRIKEFPLDMDLALETLENLHLELTTSISKILQLVSTKSQDIAETNLKDIYLAVTKLKTSLHGFTQFSESILGNASKVTDKTLFNKLLPLINSVQNAECSVGTISGNKQMQNHANQSVKIDLDPLVVCSRSLIEDIKQISSFIQGNAPLLFKKPDSSSTNKCTDNESYTNIKSKDIKPQQNSESVKACNILIQSTYNINLNDNNYLSANDKMILLFFTYQSIIYHKNLTRAIDAFLQTVEHNQPPKIFLAHGKYVVLNANKLVSIADAVHKLLSHTNSKLNAFNSANALSEAIAITVTKTKQAALNFPSVTAVQEMVDSVVDISHSARDIKLCLVQAIHFYC